MRVAFLVQGLATGGLERMVIHLAGAMVRRGHSSVILCYDRLGDLADEARGEGIDVELVARRPGVDVAYFVRLAKRLRHWAPDVLHMHNETALFYGAVAARLAGVPVRIYTEHDGVFPRGAVQSWINRRLVGQLKQAVTVSEAVKSLWCDHDGIDPSRVRVVPNGVPDRFGDGVGGVSNSSSSDDRNDHPIRIGAVSRLSREKGIDILIEAFAQLTEDGDRGASCGAVELILVGDGPERDALERLAAARGVADRVRFLGRRNDVPRHLATFDIYALPSRTEGLPMAILEAMAAGLPIVAARVGGVPEAVIHEETGLLTAPEDPAAFAAALRRTIGDGGLRRRLGEAGRRRFENHYDLDRMADRYEAIVQEGLS